MYICALCINIRIFFSPKNQFLPLRNDTADCGEALPSCTNGLNDDKMRRLPPRCSWSSEDDKKVSNREPKAKPRNRN